jgi:hypothetical protein
MESRTRGQHYTQASVRHGPFGPVLTPDGIEPLLAASPELLERYSVPTNNRLPRSLQSAHRADLDWT